MNSSLSKATLSLHENPCKDFLMRYLIDNPKTSSLSKELNTLFSQKFPESDLELELNVLYSHGIACRFEATKFFIDENTQSLIKDCHKTNRVPTWF